ncbi:hypothetical protein CR513_49327, partial [Mucuna pruriens]
MIFKLAVLVSSIVPVADRHYCLPLHGRTLSLAHLWTITAGHSLPPAPICFNPAYIDISKHRSCTSTVVEGYDSHLELLISLATLCFKSNYNMSEGCFNQMVQLMDHVDNA